MVAHGIVRPLSPAARFWNCKLSIAIAYENRIIIRMLDSLWVGGLEETAPLRVYLRVYVLDAAVGRIAL
jgi:hypothetical protein